MIKGLQRIRFENHKLFLVLPVPTHPLKKIFLYFKLCFNLKLPLTVITCTSIATIKTGPSTGVVVAVGKL